MQVNTDIFPEERRIRFHGTYGLENRSGQPVKTVYVTTPPVPELTVHQLSVVGLNAPSEQDARHGFGTYRLPEPLAPGAKAELRFDLEYTSRGFKNGDQNTQERKADVNDLNARRHQLIGGDVQGATLLSETMSQYSALMVMKHKYGAEHMGRFLRYELDRYLFGRATERNKEMPLWRVEDQGYIHYRKGSVIMYALQDYLGEDQVSGQAPRQGRAGSALQAHRPEAGRQHRGGGAALRPRLGAGPTRA